MIIIVSIIMSIAVPIDPWSHLDSKGFNAFGEQMGRPGVRGMLRNCGDFKEINQNHGKIVGKQG